MPVVFDKKISMEFKDVKVERAILIKKETKLIRPERDNLVSCGAFMTQNND